MIDFLNKNYGFVDLSEHAHESFVPFAEYVLTDRALPDVRDGLKPVHRRILFAMNEIGNLHNRPYKKSARIIGDVIGKYHPHGDSACYDSLVRMAQSWVLSVPLADGQGNWGDVDKNSAAAMRYTEVRMTRAASGMMQDLKMDTVDWKKNYDGSEDEPTVLPSRFPNLVVNGSEGIGVGMATSILPHHPVEAMNCVLALIDERKTGVPVSVDQLIEIMPAPDFPSGGIVYGLENYRDAWISGNGFVRVRADWVEEQIGGRKCIVVKALPYGVTPTGAFSQIDAAMRPDDNDRVAIPQVIDFLDDSDEKSGMRLVFELQYGVDPEIVFNEMCNLPNSCFDIAVHANINVVADQRPSKVGIRELLTRFVDFRESVVTKRTQKLLADATSRMHILEGLIKALNMLDETIATIRANPKPSEAKEALKGLLGVDDIQATKILEMTLGKLTKEEIVNFRSEHNDCALEVAELTKILTDRITLLDVIIEETQEQIDLFLLDKTELGVKRFEKRRSEWTLKNLRTTAEDLFPRENCSILMSEQGFIRRIPNSELKAQRRGTQGTQQLELGKNDKIAFANEIFSHDTLAFVTSEGRVAFCKAYLIDTSTKGRHINQVIKLNEGEKVIQLTSIDEEVIDNATAYQMVFATKCGMVKRSNFDLFSPRVSRTVKAITLADGDAVAYFGICENDDVISLVSSDNKLSRFTLSEVRETSRTSKGVLAMKLSSGNRIVSCSAVCKDEVESSVIGIVSQLGQLKLSPVDQYRQTKRNSKGVTAMKLQDGDCVLTAFTCKIDELGSLSVVSTTQQGKMNRVSLSAFRVMNRVTQGVRLLVLKDGDKLLSASLVASEVNDESVSCEDAECLE